MTQQHEPENQSRPGRGGSEAPGDGGLSFASLVLTPDIAFDTAHAVDFLDLVLGDCYGGRIGVCAIGNGPTRHAHFQWIREAVKQAEKWDRQKPVGVYFRVTMLPPTGPKGPRPRRRPRRAHAQFPVG